MKTLAAILRSRWTPAVVVLVLALAVVAKLQAWASAAERARAAEQELRRVAKQAEAEALGLLTIHRAKEQDLEAARRGMLQEKGLAEQARKLEGKRKRTVAVIDLRTGPVEAAVQVRKGDQLRIRSVGWVDELEEGTLVPQLRLVVERLSPGPVEEIASGVVDVDVSRWLQAPPSAPAPAEPGWIVGLGTGLGRRAYALQLVTPAWRVPLVGWRARWWATSVVLPGRDGLEWLVFTGPAVELGRSGR